MSETTAENDVCEASAPKKIKTSNGNTNEELDKSVKLQDFIPVKVLNSNSNRKTVCVLGKFRGKSESDLAVLSLEKNAFKLEDLNEKGYFADDNVLKTVFENDIYGNYECFPRADLNGVRTHIVYPATEKHIEKYAQKEFHIVLETPELYQTITLPYITKEQFQLQWVYNILEGKSEQDRILYNNKCEENGFVLLPDYKWDGETKETLYLLAIVRKRDIKSIRDLNETHLQLLKNIRDEGKKAIYEKYNVLGSQLRIYLHYQPSYYHLHVHFTYLKYDAPGINAERAHLLDTVIDNIEIMSNFYQKATLPFTLSEMGEFFDVYEKNNIVKRVPNNADNFNPLIDK